MQSQEGGRKNWRQIAIDILQLTLNTQYISFMEEHYW